MSGQISACHAANSAARQLASGSSMPQSRARNPRETPVAAIDYEAEYNNRARVPEHPEIFARWMREAENYRAETLKAGRAQLGLSYGDTPRQSVDLFLPEAGENAPLAIFIHGGWWRSLDPSMFSQMARGLNARGVAVAVVGYDLCPNVTIADIIEQIRRACAFLWQRFGRPHVCLRPFGRRPSRRRHGRDRLAFALSQGAGRSGAGRLFDLRRVRSGAAHRHQREPGFAARRRDEARQVSPLFWPLPVRAHFRCRRRRARVERIQAPEPDHRRDLAARPARRPATKRFAGTNHFTVIDALADPQSAMAARVAELARRSSLTAGFAAMPASNMRVKPRRCRPHVGIPAVAPAASATRRPTRQRSGRSRRCRRRSAARRGSASKRRRRSPGLPSTPSDAVAAGSRRTIANHRP